MFSYLASMYGQWIFIAVILIIVGVIVIAISSAHEAKEREEERQRKEAYRRRIRETFSNAYDIAIPDEIALEYDGNIAEGGNNYLIISFPHWRYANLDGTRNHVRVGNGIECDVSEFHCNGWSAYCKSPLDMYHFVLDARQHGLPIPLCEEEEDKKSDVKHSYITSLVENKIDAIIDKFSPNPTDFEGYCAKLFENLGYEAEVTPPIADGGYDIKLTAKNGQKALVECKCFAQNHKVGRPLLQKLSGANSTENVDTLIFITTSDYSKPAIVYAQEVGMKLINGTQLLNLRKQCGYDTKKHKRLAYSDYILSDDDIFSHYPADYNDAFAYQCQY